MGRDFNSKGGVKVFLLGSNQIVPRDSYSTAVLTDAVISQINSFSAQQPISGELFPDSQPTDIIVPPSAAVSKTTLPLPGVTSPTVHEERENSDNDAQPSQSMDSLMSDTEPTVDRGARQSRAGRRTN